MSATPEPLPASNPPAKHHRPWAWIAVCAVLALFAVGLAIWAIGLQSDLDDQKDQTAQAQQQAQQATDAVDGLKGQLAALKDRLAQAGADNGGGGTAPPEPTATPAPDAPAPDDAQPTATPEAAQPTETP